MSLKRNIIANYASQLYVTAVGILILPLYIKYMGAEAYGLVGFFTLLQAWFSLLDLGLTPTIGRETARYRGGVMSAFSYRQLFRALSIIFLAIGVFGGAGLLWMSSFIASRWLKIIELPLSEVVIAVQIMAISVALRWMGGLYRGVITGSEHLVWLGAFNSVMATLRFVAVLPVMFYVGFSPLVFFTHQLLVSVVEILVLSIKGWRLLPEVENKNLGWSFRPIFPLLKFSLAVAFGAAAWVLLTQTDKLILSGILDLREYGYFSVAVLVAGGIIMLSGPVGNSVMPNMARLLAQDKINEMEEVYRGATRLVSYIGGTATIALILTAYPLLFSWTGDKDLSEKVTPILQLYAIGNGFLVLSSFSYYIQYAYGNLRYHFFGSCGMLFILLPLQIVAAMEFGAVGAGIIWAAVNFLFLIAWAAYVHSKFAPGMHAKWLLNDVMLIIGPLAIAAYLLSLVEFEFNTRVEAFAHSLFFGLFIVFLASVHFFVFWYRGKGGNVQ